jgi:two-component system response regulator PilR (NtrC family)
MNPSERNKSKQRILHVDDDPDVRLLMAGSLQEFGYFVVTAGTVAEALQLAKGMKFSLCILDVRLPDGTGIELCQQLRELQPNVPIVYYSAYADEASQQAALSVCGDAYIKKPFSIHEWEKTIAGFLGNQDAEEAAP